MCQHKFSLLIFGFCIYIFFVFQTWMKMLHCLILVQKLLRVNTQKLCWIQIQQITTWIKDLHFIILKKEKLLLFALGRPTIINTLKMLLWDKDSRSYSYYIEVSMDNQDWVKVIDYSKYLCYSWQTLHFDPRVVRYM